MKIMEMINPYDCTTLELSLIMLALFSGMCILDIVIGNRLEENNYA